LVRFASLLVSTIARSQKFFPGPRGSAQLEESAWLAYQEATRSQAAADAAREETDRVRADAEKTLAAFRADLRARAERAERETDAWPSCGRDGRTRTADGFSRHLRMEATCSMSTGSVRVHSTRVTPLSWCYTARFRPRSSAAPLDRSHPVHARDGRLPLSVRSGADPRGGCGAARTRSHQTPPARPWRDRLRSEQRGWMPLYARAQGQHESPLISRQPWGLPG